MNWGFDVFPTNYRKDIKQNRLHVRDWPCVGLFPFCYVTKTSLSVFRLEQRGMRSFSIGKKETRENANGRKIRIENCRHAHFVRFV